VAGVGGVESTLAGLGSAGTGDSATARLKPPAVHEWLTAAVPGTGDT